MDNHEYFINKLTLLVRDALNLEYIKIVISVVPSIGIQIISSYHANTGCTISTHCSLKKFFGDLYSILLNKASDLFKFYKPLFERVTDRLFQSTNTLYIPEMVQAVVAMLTEYSDDCIELARAPTRSICCTVLHA